MSKDNALTVSYLISILEGVDKNKVVRIRNHGESGNYGEKYDVPYHIISFDDKMYDFDDNPIFNIYIGPGYDDKHDEDDYNKYLERTKHLRKDPESK